MDGASATHRQSRRTGWRSVFCGPFVLITCIMFCGCHTPQPDEGTTNLTETAGQPSNAVSASLVLVNGTLIDGTGSAAVPDAVVALDGEQIVAVGTREQVVLSPHTPTIDVQGATILPGFINTHVHEADNRESLVAWAQAGVTTVRDLGNNGTPSDLFAFRDEVSADPKYARLVAAGPMVTVPGGYGRQPVTSAEDARQIITTILNDGADLIKIGIEDDLQGRMWPMLSAEEIRTIVDTAHARNMPVAAHISRSRHLELALETGVDDVAHMIVDNLTDELIEGLIKASVYWEPTLELWQCVSRLHGLSWDATAIDNLRLFSQAGGKVALGTDFAGYRCQFDLGMPVTELELMRKAGMTPLQIIVAATKNAAHVCNLEEEVGTLEPGKLADILIVEGNPLEDIQALTAVRMVIHNGVVIRKWDPEQGMRMEVNRSQDPSQVSSRGLSWPNTFIRSRLLPSKLALESVRSCRWPRDICAWSSCACPGVEAIPCPCRIFSSVRGR